MMFADLKIRPMKLFVSFWPPGHVSKGPNAIKLIVFTGLACLFLGGFDAAVAQETVRSGVVTRVVDGDTVWIKLASLAEGDKAGEVLKVRIVGIDAPEICQPGGAQSLAALRSHVLGQTVTLSSSPSTGHDDYGRVLGLLDKQGEDVGRWMVRRGQAWSDSYRRNPSPYAAEQTQAQAAGVGLFAQAEAESPRSFRKRHGSCYP